MKKILLSLLLYSSYCCGESKTIYEFYEYYTIRNGCLEMINTYGDATRSYYSRDMIVRYINKLDSKMAWQVLKDLVKEKKMPQDMKGKKK